MGILEEIKKSDEPPTKPLVVKKEIREMARKAVLAEVQDEIQRLTQKENTEQEILSILKEIQRVIMENREEDSKTLELKRQVLEKLKAKLENV
jgi:predicted 2-oxoglutarate/Fe(II)-dependent dioxygenase YbiX